MLDNSCESYPSSFQGGVSDEATLTAFVTVSLLESGMSPEVLLTSCAIRSLRLVIEFCVQPLRKCWVDVRWKVLHPLFKSSIMLVNSQRVPHSHFVWNFCFFAHGKPLTCEGNEEVMNFLLLFFYACLYWDLEEQEWFTMETIPRGASCYRNPVLISGCVGFIKYLWQGGGGNSAATG